MLLIWLLAEHPARAPSAEALGSPKKLSEALENKNNHIRQTPSTTITYLISRTQTNATTTSNNKLTNQATHTNNNHEINPQLLTLTLHC